MTQHAGSGSRPEVAQWREIERLAAALIGRFPAACGGRHFEGHTCDYCLVDDILRVVRGAIDEMQPGGQRQPWEAGTHGPATCAILEDDPPRFERDGSTTLDIAPRAGERTNTPPPGPPPLTADVPGGAQHAGSAGPCERCGNGNLCECDMGAAWNLACLHVARKLEEDSSPPWDETVRRCALIARAARRTDGVGGEGVPRRDAPVTTQAGSLDSGLTDRGPSGAPSPPAGIADPLPSPATASLPLPAPDDTNAGGGAPAEPRPCRLILNGEWCLEHNAPAARVR